MVTVSCKGEVMNSCFITSTMFDSTLEEHLKTARGKVMNFVPMVTFSRLEFYSTFFCLLKESSHVRITLQLRFCAYTVEGQFSGISPHGARVKTPSATMSPTKPVMNDIRHEEWYGGEVVHATFEAPVCSSKYEWGDSILRTSQ